MDDGIRMAVTIDLSQRREKDEAAHSMEVKSEKPGGLSPVRLLKHDMGDEDESKVSQASTKADKDAKSPRTSTKTKKEEDKATRTMAEKDEAKTPRASGKAKKDRAKIARATAKAEKDLPQSEKSSSDDTAIRKERLYSRSSETFDRPDSRSTSLSISSPKVSRKYFTNWRQACDKTKDQTKELFKRWRTLPESEGEPMSDPERSDHDKTRGWSVHVWTTWVNRCSEDLECLDPADEQPLTQLSSVQAHKMTLFFAELLDHDCDNVITENDFDLFFEKLAHFADWSNNSSEFHIMLEVKAEFIEHFIEPLPPKYAELPYYKRVCGPDADSLGLPGRTTLEGWLARWALQLAHVKRFSDLPLYLQYFCKILFHVVDRTSSGTITKPALAAFYGSVIGLRGPRVDEIIDTAYDRMTSKAFLILDYGSYVHCFTNWLMGRNPNGPGQWLLVPPKDALPQPPFPVDYSALNTDPEKLEPYVPDRKTNRHSVIV